MEFCWRLTALVALMAVVAWIDWRRYGEWATKWREYGFLLAAGVLGGLVGVGIDQLTSTISPEYFVLGKGIPNDAAFRAHIATLGFQAGLVMGILIGGVYLLANNPRPDRIGLSYFRLFRYAVAPLMAAIMISPISALVVGLSDPLNLDHELRDMLPPTQINHFRLVWGIHLGLYAGGIIGAAIGVVQIRRSRIGVGRASNVKPAGKPPASTPPETRN
jgi:hypothetical protein